MKFLIVMNGWITEIGGAEKHIFEVTHYWANNHETRFLLPKSAFKHFKNMQYQNKPLVGSTIQYSIPFEVQKSTLGLNILWLLRILRTLFLSIPGRVDVVVATSHLTSNIIPSVLIKKRKASILVVYVYHLLNPKENIRSLSEALMFIREKIDLWLVKKNADVIFVENSLVAEDLLTMGFKKSKIFGTSDGFDVDFTAKVSTNKEHGSYDGCFAGRIVETKGVFDLITIWRDVCAEKPSARLAIIGGGPELPELNQKIAALGLQKNIDLLGFVSEEEKIGVMKSSKIFLFPSYQEGWPLAICEATMCGSATVAYNLPVYREVLGDSIITVSIHDTVSFSKAILTLLANEEDRKTIVNQAQERCKGYTWEKASMGELIIIHNNFK